MSRETLEAGYFRSYERFYSWSSILDDAGPGTGFAKRLFLNVAYKKWSRCTIF